MNQRDRDLLDKQFAWMRPAPRPLHLKFGVSVAILLVGLVAGSTVILHDPNSPVVAASTSALPTVLASFDATRSKL